MSHDIDVRHLSLAYLLSEIVLGVAERGRVTVAPAKMSELIERMAQGLRDERQRFELAERLRDAADVIERRRVVEKARPAQLPSTPHRPLSVPGPDGWLQGNP
jgi:hypothetical protein